MADLPKFPNWLRYIRENRHLSLANLASEVGTSADKLQKIEEGLAVPSLRQFGLLSQVLGVADYEIAGTERPTLLPILADLRTPTVIPTSISGKGLKAYFSRSATASVIQSLAQSLQIRPTLARPASLTVPNLIGHLPQILGLLKFDPREAQWIDQPEKAWRYLRLQIEKFGIYCFLAEVPPEDFRGLFTKIDDGASLIIVNKRTFKTKARMFTLMHEFAHFLLNLEGISDPLIINNQAERVCNQFASHTLLPSDLLVKLFASAGKRSISGTISYISHRCLLSQGAVAYRLQKDNVISDKDYKSWFIANGMNVGYGKESTDEELEEEDPSGGGNYAYGVVSNYGFRPFQILSHALMQGVIDTVHVAHIVNARGPTQELAFKTAIDRVAELEP